jgi:hypothetical protein
MSMHRATLIAFTGAAGAGKDTAAAILADRYGYKKISFGAVLKDVLAVMFGWPRDLLEGVTAESREWREKEDAWWSSRLGRTITPRGMLMEIGTDVFRQHFHDEIWVACLERRLCGAAVDDKYVITDCRFNNEAEMIRRCGGEIIRVERGDDCVAPVQHESERGISAEYVTATIKNNGMLFEFEERIAEYFNMRG